MKYLYKFIDDKEKLDIKSNQRISLSRPIFEFNEPEGIVVGFFRDIAKLIDDINEEERLSQIIPPSFVIEGIKSWCNDHRESMKYLGDEEDSVHSLISEFRILTCLYFQTYCGYYTEENLFDSEILKQYRGENKRFIEEYKKTAILRIAIPDNTDSWEYTPEQESGDFVFKHNPSAVEGKNNIVSFLHYHKVRYLTKELGSLDILRMFNENDERKLSSLLEYSTAKFKQQKETRLFFTLPSNKPNSTLLAFDSSVMLGAEPKTIEESLFQYALITFYKAKNDYPRFIYLDTECSLKDL